MVECAGKECHQTEKNGKELAVNFVRSGPNENKEKKE